MHKAGLLTLSGLSVYLEFGLAIPKSGGEKNYLERIFRRPRHLATSVFAVQMVLLGFSAGNSLAFGRYVLLAVGRPMPDGWIPRIIAVVCMTFVIILHTAFPKWGLRLTNALGIFKVLVLLLIVFSGFAALAGYRLVPDPHNFENFWAVEKGEGYGGGGTYAYATALLQVVYSYKGWENANYVMDELKNPQRTLKIAAPLAVIGITVLYVLANVAYFAAIPKAELAQSEVIVAGLFFRNVFGESAAARSLPAFVALSNIGNVLAVSFAHSRVNQELAREGILPWSGFWASNKPFGTPAASVSATTGYPRESQLTKPALPPLDSHRHCSARASTRPSIQFHCQPVSNPLPLKQNSPSNPCNPDTHTPAHGSTPLLPAA